jgi:amino acid adenylation domain-containing protein
MSIHGADQPIAAEVGLARLLAFPAAWARRPAFASSAGQLTFADFREGALRCCRLLRERFEVGPGARVAFCLPKSLGAVQVIWGILAAGAAYVPLQFRGPPARLNAILRSTEPRLLVTTAEMEGLLTAGPGWPALPVCPVEVADAGQGLAALLRGLGPAEAFPPRSSEDLAAIYFTSGSTGEPKGVMLSHGSIAAGVDLIARRDGMTDRDRLLSHTSLHYAAYDMFLPFAVGCRTFLLSDEEAMIPASVTAALERERATVWRSTITALRHLLEGGELAARDLGSLRLLGLFGEPLPIPLLRRLMAALPAVKLSFNYGATEAYRIASYDIPRDLPEDLVSLPIGRAGAEYVLSLRDEDDWEVEDGAEGEICVEGPPVMLGYWKDPGLTASRRLLDRPHSWRTGDIGYRDENGLLHVVGRKDHVVKIRGHRFDLGEIEAVLRGHPAVRDAVALLVARDEDRGEIHAAVLAEDSEELRRELRRACSRSLPVFARPTRIAMYRQFPTLPTGKVDRMALRARLTEARDRSPP